MAAAGRKMIPALVAAFGKITKSAIYRLGLGAPTLIITLHLEGLLHGRKCPFILIVCDLYFAMDNIIIYFNFMQLCA